MAEKIKPRNADLMKVGAQFYRRHVDYRGHGGWAPVNIVSQDISHGLLRTLKDDIVITGPKINRSGDYEFRGTLTVVPTK